jgi:hypothetical protein
MIFQPPKSVPNPMAMAQRRTTHFGTSRVSILPAARSAMVMMPMDFWASLDPWPNAMKDDESNWSLPKYLLMVPGAR